MSSAMAAGPTVSGTPTAITKDGTAVTVTGSGFNPSSTIYVMQCSSGTPTGCNLGGVKVLAADANGAVSTSFKVVMGTVGDGKCVAGSTACFLAVTDGTADNTKAVKLTFPKATTTPVTKPVTKPITKPVTKPTSGKTTTTTKTTTQSSGSGSVAHPTAVAAGSAGLVNDESSQGGPALAIGLGGTALAGATLLQARRGRREES
jgi:hypothetical protein